MCVSKLENRFFWLEITVMFVIIPLETSIQFGDISRLICSNMPIANESCEFVIILRIINYYWRCSLPNFIINIFVSLLYFLEHLMSLLAFSGESSVHFLLVADVATAWWSRFSWNSWNYITGRYYFSRLFTNKPFSV